MNVRNLFSTKYLILCFVVSCSIIILLQFDIFLKRISFLSIKSGVDISYPDVLKTIPTKGLNIDFSIQELVSFPVLYVRITITSKQHDRPYYALRNYILSSGIESQDDLIYGNRSANPVELNLNPSLILMNPVEKYSSNKERYIPDNNIGYLDSNRRGRSRFNYRIQIPFPTHDYPEIIHNYKPAKNPSGIFIVKTDVRLEYKSVRESLLDPQHTTGTSFVGKDILLPPPSSLFYLKFDENFDLRKWFKDSWFINLNETRDDNFDYSYLQRDKCSPRLLRDRILGPDGVKLTTRLRELNGDHEPITMVRLFIIGDSQPSNECRLLQNLLQHNASHRLTSYSQDIFKGAVPDAKEFNSSGNWFYSIGAGVYKTNEIIEISVECGKAKAAPSKLGAKWLEQAIELLESLLDRRHLGLDNRSKKKVRNVLVVNFAGLWEAAYATLSNEAEVFKLLEGIMNRFLDVFPGEVYYHSTTAVNPIHYERLREDVEKWAFTQPRVELVNRLTLHALKANYRSRDRVMWIDTATVSKVGELDPEQPDDMRHFGVATNEKLLNYILCKVLS